MEGTYSVYFGDSICGKLHIQKRGLYYRFFCRCTPDSKMVCRLRAQFPDCEESIGILTPVEDGFGLCKEVPINRFSGEPLRFAVIPVHTHMTGNYIPIIPEEPFSYIERLKDAYLVKRDGEFGMFV